MNKTHILVVEDEGIVALDIQNRLKRSGYVVAGVASSGPEAIRKAREVKPHLVLMDIKLKGDMDGIEAAQHINSQLDIPVVYLTAYADETTLKKANLAGPFGYLLKPFKERALVATIQMALSRHQLEQRLKESEQWFSTTLKSIGDAVIATDNQGCIKFMNPLAEMLTGSNQTEAVGVESEKIFKIIDDTTRKNNPSPVEQVLRTGEVVFLQNNTLLLAEGGKETPIDDSAAPILDNKGNIIGVVLVFRDVTERKQAQRAMLQTQKLESLGVLAGGVAHDFNNLLVAILGQVELALAKSTADSPVRNHMEKAVRAAEQAAELTNQLLAYSGRGQFERQPINLNDLVRNNQQLFAVSLPKNVQVLLELEESLPLIEADPSQMQQVIMNLLLNAAEAIGEHNGTVTIRTGTQEVTTADEHLWKHTGDQLTSGNYFSLEVCDTGCGMETETLSKIFDPFFTTKINGRGLGLAAVLGIVRGHGGGLTIDSKPDQGTTFNLVFPFSVIEPVAMDEVISAVEGETHSGQALVIDDELYVLEAVTDILMSAGIQVMTAPNGLAGLVLYRKHAADINLVLLDLSMPGMNGAETFQKLREINPQVKVLLSSGYDKEVVDRRFDWQGLAGFIQKPYNLSVLIDTVKRHL